MKLTRSRTRWSAGATTTLAVAVIAIAACGGGGAASASNATVEVAPRPVAGDVEGTVFDTSLHIDLSTMLRRPDGLYVKDLTTGTGAIAARARKVIVLYSGFFPDGKAFDSGEITVDLGTNRVIRAWEEGLLGMRVGGKRLLVSPANLAYGSKGSQDVIPPNQVLVFTMELTAVQP